MDWSRARARAAAVAASAPLVTLTLVLPGSTLAVGLLIAYGRWLGGTLAIILLAYLAKLWAFAHRPDRRGAWTGCRRTSCGRHGRAAPGLLTAVRTVALRPLAPALRRRPG